MMESGSMEFPMVLEESSMTMARSTKDALNMESPTAPMPSLFARTVPFIVDK